MTKIRHLRTCVSTADQQDPETQLLDLRLMAKQRGYAEVVHEYTDISGAKSNVPV